MAKIIRDNQEMETPNGERIQLVCEEMGIPFGCKSGLCRTCEILVLEGMDNLEAKNEQEVDQDLDAGHRLACQCVIKHGTIRIKEIN